jgi:hypothetical protein
MAEDQPNWPHLTSSYAEARLTCPKGRRFRNHPLHTTSDRALNRIDLTYRGHPNINLAITVGCRAMKGGPP